MKYEGWTNYSTWTIYVYISNELEIHEELLSRRYDFVDFEDVVKEIIEDLIERDVSGNSIAYNLAYAGLSQVNWRELAQHYKDYYR